MQQEGGGGGSGGGGGGGGQQSQYGEMGGPPTTGVVSETSEQLVEAASPISSRPPAAASGNLDEFMRLASVGGGDELGLGDRGGGGSGAASGNRWPRQETLALLKIRSDMDATFRDATVKGPLWEDVSRKLAELGYKRSAKKCREKFENVHKYYKRTKEARAGRQDGKSYKFFSELEALQTTSATAPVTPATAVTPVSLDVAPVSVGIPMPISSARIPHTPAIPMSSSLLAIPGSAPAPAPAPVPAPAPPIAAAPFGGISFSSNSSTFSQGFDDDDDDEEEDEVGVGGGGGEPSSMAGTSRKRKRSSSRGAGGSTTRRMMEFFEGLMKQVMQKQEAMQQRFLEAIEKREQDRTIREEAWKRQELARLSREHELMAQERAISASRDAAIVSFLQKITGQTIQLPTPVTTVTIPAAPPPPPPSQPSVPVVQPEAPIPTPAPPSHQPPSLPQQQQQQQQPPSRTLHNQHQQQAQQLVQHQQHQQHPISSEVVMAIPEQQVPPQEIGGSGSGSMEPASSRWPKTEVLALINLRSGLEARYQEAGPKGPLWEEISAGMSRMGYKRSAKRCKEKWENINKYFKKVKESNKKRPEDAKTCPYYHQLDALYRKKILGGGTSSGSFSDHTRAEEETSRLHQDTKDPPPSTAAPRHSENETGLTADVVTSKHGDPYGEGNSGGAKKPEDIVRELMEEQGKGFQLQQHHHHHHHQGQSLLVDGYDHKINDEADSDNMDDDDDDGEDEDEEMEEERKMGYKIEFQRQNSSAPNGGGNGAGAPSFFTMVQ